MADRVEINEAAIMEMARNWDSPVGTIIIAATEHVADYMQMTAPVSPVGSQYAPRGFLKSTIGAAEPTHYDDEGRIMGLAGTHTNRTGGGYPYPLSFIFNTSGRTSNPYMSRRTHKPIPGRRRTYRAATNAFIKEAVNSLASFIYRTGT
jgi:hypothetical protein